MRLAKRLAALGWLVLAAGIAARAEVAIPDRDILALSPEIERFLDENVGQDLDRTSRLYSLMDAIFSRRGLDLTYTTSHTKTAIETFETKSGNCLSFTLMFVAMARHVGLAASFQEVPDVLSWDRRGDTILSNKHIYAVVELDNARMRVDFLPHPEGYFGAAPIPDFRAWAHYYNNLGAEGLADDDVELAISYFRKALEHDPRFTPAWSNLGAAQRRRGDLEAAEESYRMALEIDPEELTAASNLAGLYHLQGRSQEARPLLARVESLRRRNPFHHYRLAVEAARAGATEQAIRHLRNAIRRRPKDPQFYAFLAALQERSGAPKKAVRSLERAVALEDDAGRRQLLEERLRRLQQEGHGG